MDRIGCMSAHSSTAKENNEEGTSWLPPGFRFHPTDEELVTFYLASKIENPNFCDQAISEADLNKSEPWELPGKAKMGEKEWYFYSLKDRKYPTGVRTNRATQAGYWKATGKDREVVVSSETSLKGKLVGMKKTLVFYQGRAPKGTKSNWVMHEYRAQEALIHSLKSKSSKDEWVLCRVFHKSAGGKKMALADLDFATTLMGGSNSVHHTDARIAKMAAMLPALTEVPWSRSNPTQQATVFFSHLSRQNPPAAPSNSYSSGRAAPSQACSYLSGQLQNATGQQAGPHQLANLLNSIPSGRSAGDSVFTALYEHYNQQVKVEPLQLQDYRQLQVQQTSANVHVPVNTWAGMQDVNTIQASSSGRLSPDSCASTLEFAPSPHITTSSTYNTNTITTTTTTNSSSMPQYFIPRLPSDLESFWTTDFLHAN